MLFLCTIFAASNALYFDVGSLYAQGLVPGTGDVCKTYVDICEADPLCVAHDEKVHQCLTNPMMGINYNQTGMGAGILTHTQLGGYAMCSFLENLIVTVPALGLNDGLPFINTEYRNLLECSAFANNKMFNDNMGQLGVPTFQLGEVAHVSPSTECWDSATVCLMDPVCKASFQGHIAKGIAKNIPMIDLSVPYNGMILPNFAALTKDQACDLAEIFQDDFKKGTYNNKEQALLSCFVRQYDIDVPYCMDKLKAYIEGVIVMIGALSGAGGLVLGLISFGVSYYMCCRGSKVTP